MFKLKKSRVLMAVIIMICTAVYLYWQNNAIVVSNYTTSKSTIPDAFDGFKIVQISDTHNKDFGNQLTDKVRDQNPDIIVMTGDLIDRNRTDVTVAIDTLEDMIDIAPIYFISGNHEMAFGEYDYLKTELTRIGVHNLDNAHENIVIDDTKIGLIGIEDPLFMTLEEVERAGSEERVILSNIDRLIEESASEYTILLSHRAELMMLYVESGIDLVMTGHAHGGQIRVPFVEGIFAPSQGFLPSYTNGVYEENGTQMIVSRGLGNSIFPFRINNRPEIVVTTLKSE